MLEAHLTTDGTAARLIARSQMPRSCAPWQVSHQIPNDAGIYDDADFYGLLLQNLLEQRSGESIAAATAGAANMSMPNGIDARFQLRREAKTRKQVDTRASKGRKLRYTVHEKLQNFMAPEDRTTWGPRQSDELFGSLFGKKMELGEDVDGINGDEEDGLGAEEAGLMLFRS